MKKLSVKIFGFAAMAALVCLLGMGQAGAYDQDDLDRLLKTNSCSSCDLTPAFLTGAILTGATLSEADPYKNWIQIAMYRGPSRISLILTVL